MRIISTGIDISNSKLSAQKATGLFYFLKKKHDAEAHFDVIVLCSIFQ